MAALTSTPQVDAVVAAAQTLGQLKTGLETIDPAMAQQLESKALVASKSPWGTLLVTAITWASSKYGIGLDDTTSALIAGAGVLVGSYAMRAITQSPISGIFSKKT